MKRCNIEAYLADNAPVHTREFSSKVVKWCDLVPSDFYLFTHLKKDLRGNRFKTKDDLKEAVTNWLNEKPSDFYKEAFLELARRWKKCVAAYGSYIEK